MTGGAGFIPLRRKPACRGLCPVHGAGRGPEDIEGRKKPAECVLRTRISLE